MKGVVQIAFLRDRRTQTRDIYFSQVGRIFDKRANPAYRSEPEVQADDEAAVRKGLQTRHHRIRHIAPVSTGKS